MTEAVLFHVGDRFRVTADPLKLVLQERDPKRLEPKTPREPWRVLGNYTTSAGLAHGLVKARQGLVEASNFEGYVPGLREGIRGLTAACAALLDATKAVQA